MRFNSLRGFVSSLKRTERSKQQACKRSSLERPLALEQLETRLTPAGTFTWTGGGASNLWSDSGNWGGATLNTSTGQDATLIFPDGAARKTNQDNISGLSVAQIQVAGGYAISGAAVTLTGAAPTYYFSNTSWMATTGIVSASGTNTINNQITLASNIGFDVDAGELSIGGVIGGDFHLSKTGTGTLVLNAANTYTGGVTAVLQGTLRCGTVNTIQGQLLVGETIGPATVDLAGHAQTVTGYHTFGDGIITNSGALTTFTHSSSASTGATVPLSGPITLVKAGTSNVFLSNLNTHTGGTRITGGIVRISEDSALGAVPAVPTPGNLTIDGGMLLFVLGNPVTLNANRGVSLGAGGGNLASRVTYSYDGVIDGIGSLTVSNGTFLLGGHSTYAGSTIITNNPLIPNSIGQIDIANDNALPTTTLLTVSVGTFNLNGHSQSISGLADGGVNTGDIINNAAAATATLTDNVAGSASFSGVISGNVSFVKSGAGTQTLSGANTYTGATIINGGTLLINGAQPSSTVTVSFGGALGGTNGTVGQLNVVSGTIRPGAAAGSTGILNSGNFTSYNPAFNIDLNGTVAGASYDQLNVAGVVTLGGSATLNVTAGFTPAVGNTFTIINNDGSDPINGTFLSLPEGATFAVGATTFQITYRGGTGNDVVLTRVNSTASTTTAVASSPNPSVYGQAVTFTATVTPGTSPFTPTGTVTFKDGDTTIGTGSLSTTAGVTKATLTVSTLSAGTHSQIVAQYAGDSHFAGSNSANYTQTVSPAPLTVTATGQNKVYDATDTAMVTLSDNRAAGDVLTVSYTSATFADKNVGDGKSVSISGISISGAAAGNYALQNTTASTTANITPASLTVSATGVNKVYDAATTASVTLSDNALGNDDVTNSYTIAAFADKNVGNPKQVGVSGISIGGADAGNYILQNTTASATANITPASLTLSATGIDKVYDATTAATVTLSDNRIAGDVFSDSYTSASFADKNAGTGKTVSVSGISISGADAGNYSFNTSTATTASITPRGLSVSATGVDKEYDGTSAATVTLSDNRIAGDVFADDYGTAAFGDKNVGTDKPVSVSDISIGGADAGNYSLENISATTTATITARALAVSASGLNKVYDGTVASAVTLSDDRVAGDMFSDSYTSAVFSDKNVGTGKPVSVSGISISGADAGNYTFNGTASTTADITPRSITVTADPQIKHLGAVDPMLTYQVTSGNLVDNDEFSGSLTRDAGEAVGVYAIRQGSLTASSNYALSYVGADLTIQFATTATTVGSSANPAVFGQPVLFTASITSNNLAVTVGTVQFVVDGVNFGAPVNVSAQGKASVTAQFLTGNSHTFQAIYTDASGSFADSSSSVEMQTVQSVARESIDGQTVLFVAGSTSADKIHVRLDNDQVRIKLIDGSPEISTPLAELAGLVIYGNGGGDYIKVDDKLTLPAYLFAGNGGKAHLEAGGGPSVLVGGDGDDVLLGGSGRNIMIGGLGADQLLAKTACDILIGGMTSHDANLAALMALATEWSRLDESYLQRVANLTHSAVGGVNPNASYSAGYYLNATTVANDGAVDHLVGGSDLDLFFASLQDKVTRKSNEIVIPIE